MSQIPVYGKPLVLEVGSFPETHHLEAERHDWKLDGAQLQ